MTLANKLKLIENLFKEKQYVKLLIEIKFEEIPIKSKEYQYFVYYYAVSSYKLGEFKNALKTL